MSTDVLYLHERRHRSIHGNMYTCNIWLGITAHVYKIDANVEWVSSEPIPLRHKEHVMEIPVLTLLGNVHKQKTTVVELL